MTQLIAFKTPATRQWVIDNLKRKEYKFVGGTITIFCRDEAHKDEILEKIRAVK
jgi:hypothetical protein